MHWAAYSSIFLLSTVKFMFAPFTGPISKLTFTETYIVCVSGAIISSATFFFLANFFMEYSIKKQEEKYKKALAKGLNPKKKKTFTQSNKLIVKIKRTVGIMGITFFVPLFFSIPLGSIIVAKFYGDNKLAYPLVLSGILINGVILTSLAYFVF